MLSTPKKSPAKGENKPTSETASFKKVAYGFAPDEVNLYISSLRKKNLELQSDNEKLTEQINPEKEIRMETLEKRLSESDERYIKQKEVATMLETECGRLLDETEKLTAQLRTTEAKLKAAESGAPSETSAKEIESLSAQLSAAESKFAKAQNKLASLETDLAETQGKLSGTELSLSENENKLADAKSKLTEAKSAIADYESKLAVAEGRISESDKKLAVAEGKISESDKKLAEAEKTLKETKEKLSLAVDNAAIYEEKLAAAEEEAMNSAKAAETAKTEAQAAKDSAAAQISAAQEKQVAQTPAAQTPPVQEISEVQSNMDFSEFQLPEEEETSVFLEEETVSAEDLIMFEEEPAAVETPKTKAELDSELLATALTEIAALKKQIAGTQQAPQEKAPQRAEQTAKPAEKAKPAASQKSASEEEAGRAELRIKIQDEAEDSYIIPEKYLKMIADIEDEEGEDDFSYLLTGSSTDDDDINSFMVSPPPVQKRPAPKQSVRTQAPPPKPQTRSAETPPPPPDYEQYTRQASVQPPNTPPVNTSPIRMAPRPASQGQGQPKPISGANTKPLIKAEATVSDDAFTEMLVRDHDAGASRGTDLIAKDPYQPSEKGDDLQPLDPYVVEKGDDLNNDLYEMVITDYSNASANDFDFSYGSTKDDDDDMSAIII
ncbi:MAG: hypothetical protein FWG44_05435 [Oscillospiraceae bacterium]|nr:hypothetical protein [Oscillospiraceae bacterium]